MAILYEKAFTGIIEEFVKSTSSPEYFQLKALS